MATGFGIRQHDTNVVKYMLLFFFKKKSCLKYSTGIHVAATKKGTEV